MVGLELLDWTDKSVHQDRRAVVASAGGAGDWAVRSWWLVGVAYGGTIRYNITHG